MEIKISPIEQGTTLTTQNEEGGVPYTSYRIGQKVNFMEITNGESVANSKPVKRGYNFGVAVDQNGVNPLDVVAFLDYTTYASENLAIAQSEGYAPIRSSSTLTVDIFKQEVEEVHKIINGQDTVIYNALTVLEPVALGVTQFHIKDYLVSNDRKYQYYIYPSNNNIPLALEQSVVSVKWQGWSLTELHPLDTTGKKFSASPSDVWIFNFNVETGEMTQNINRQEEETLGTYLSYSQGPQNYISGQVSCLLGRDMILASSYFSDPNINVSNGNAWYQEYFNGSKKLSSNERVDMLKEWRKVAFSSNPKLLKDRKGQMFLVTLTNLTSQTNEKIPRLPETISFAWTQIGDLDDVTIIGEG